MERGVVGKHQGANVVLPIQRSLVGNQGEVFGDGFVSHLSLAVALRVVWAGHCVADFEKCKEFVAELGAEFFALMGDNF